MIHLHRAIWFVIALVVVAYLSGCYAQYQPVFTEHTAAVVSKDQTILVESKTYTHKVTYLGMSGLVCQYMVDDQNYVVMLGTATTFPGKLPGEALDLWCNPEATNAVVEVIVDEYATVSYPSN